MYFRRLRKQARGRKNKRNLVDWAVYCADCLAVDKSRPPFK